LFFVMSFAQHVELVGAGVAREGSKVFLIEGGDDQQDGVSAICPRLYDLEFIEDEILAQAGERCGGRRLAQIGERTLKELLVSKHGKGSGAGLGEFAGKGGGLKIGADQAFRGRGLFQFRDNRNLLPRYIKEPCPEAPRGMLYRLTLKCAQVNAAPSLGQTLAASSDNGVERGWHDAGTNYTEGSTNDDLSMEQRASPVCDFASFMVRRTRGDESRTYGGKTGVPLKSESHEIVGIGPMSRKPEVVTKLFFRPFGAGISPSFVPGLARAAFLRRFAANMGRQTPLA
jgi:hypothetical protein